MSFQKETKKEMNPSRRKNIEEHFCTEQGEYVNCDADCVNCFTFKDSIEGKNYP